MSTDRRPLIVLLCLALLAIAIYVTGAVGVARSPGPQTSPGWFSASPPGGLLTTDDLQVDSGACSVAGGAVAFTGVCALRVRAVVGGFPWTDATRRAKLAVDGSSGSVTVGVTVQNKPMSKTVAAGESVRLVFTRDAGQLTLGCLGLTTCRVTLTEDSGP